MFDNLTKRLMESAAESYMPRLEALANERKAKLKEMRAKVRTHPEEVEAWLEKEIGKVGDIDPTKILDKINFFKSG
jgi:hypothetical protein